MSIDIETRLLVDDLLTTSAMLVDRLEFEAWIELFVPEARYMVIPRENRLFGYPAAIINCQRRAILEDRINVLRKSSKYNPHYDRHILSRSEFRGRTGNVIEVETNFAIVQSSMEGFSKLFVAGTYEDKVVVEGGVARFHERVAVVDTFSVPNLIATPI